MALNKEIWTADIIENLYKDNSFAQRCVNRDEHVLAGTVVHTPVAGNPAGVKKNLSSFPATATTRADQDGTYALDAIYSLPRRIPNLDKYELSYDKRQSVIGEDTQNLIQKAHDNLLYRWSPTGATATPQIIELSGADSGEDLLTGATGLRSTFTKADLKKAVKAMAKNEFGAFRKVALLTAAHYHQLFDSLSDAEKHMFNNVADAKEGVIARYMGVDIMMRTSVGIYEKAGAVFNAADTLDDAFAPKTGHLSASLIWAENAVERALGTVDVFDNPGEALYYGDVFSAMMYFGGRIRRAKGVFALVEKAS